MRTIPPVPFRTWRAPDWEEEIELVFTTRLFGGGVVPKTLDPIWWLRPSAAKSAIRAWWRIGQAHRFPSLEALRERESFLFGSSARRDKDGNRLGGPGVLEVTVTTTGQPATERYHETAASPFNLALFPAAESGDGDNHQPAAHLGRPSEDCIAKVRLRIRNDVSKAREDVLEGLRLWLTLGGAGARTRRGVGALALRRSDKAAGLGVPATREELETFLRGRCARKEVEVDGIFSLSRTRCVFVGQARATAEEAQKRLLLALKEARQGKGSNWPEADAIRWKANARNAEARGLKVDRAKRYPRMVLGLPIVFHFVSFGHPEPRDHYLYAVDRGFEPRQKFDRYSSPILLRPVRIWERGQPRYVPVAIFTDCTLPDSARPLIVTNASIKVEEITEADIAHSFEPLAEANATFRAVESAFERADFTRLS